MLKLLAMHGADLNGKNPGGNTALINVCRFVKAEQNIEVARCLFSLASATSNSSAAQGQSIDINARGEYNVTAFCCAVEKKNMDMVNLLAEHDADVNLGGFGGPTGGGSNPMGMAIWDEDTELVELLLRLKANPEQSWHICAGGPPGMPAVAMAARKGNMSILKLLKVATQ